MDLYDDLDAKQRAGQIDGWSSGIKLLQTQLALKKATVPPPVKKEPPKRPAVSVCRWNCFDRFNGNVSFANYSF